MNDYFIAEINDLRQQVKDLRGLETPAFTAGAVVFGASSGLPTEDATNLLWDDTNNRLTITGLIFLGAGTSFPGSPPTNGVYFRTDRGRLHYYDGSQWLTFNDYQVRFPLTTFSATTEDTTNLEAMDNDFASYFTRLDVVVNTGATNNGSNFWTVRLRGGATTTIASVDTSASAAATSRIRLSTTTMVQLGATTAFVNLRVEKTGAPSNIDVYAVARYKLIG